MPVKALVYELNEKLSIQEKPVPEPREGEALVRVTLAGICGSDIVAWQGGFKRITKPVILGHEFSGVIERINSDEPQPFSVGDPVTVEPLISCGHCEACRKGYYHVCRTLGLLGLDYDGGFTSYVRVPLNRIHPLPASMPDERAVFAEPTAVAVHMVRRSGLQVGGTAAIFGAGPIGLLVAMVARVAGASHIVLSDINEHRLRMAEEMGFETVDARTDDAAAQVKARFGVEGADIAFELAASPIALNNAIETAKIRGTVVAGGMFKQPPVIDLQKVSIREQTVVGTRVYNFTDYDAALKLLADPAFPVEKLISRIVGLEDAIEQGFTAIKNGENLMKVLIRLGEK